MAMAAVDGVEAGSEVLIVETSSSTSLTWCGKLCGRLIWYKASTEFYDCGVHCVPYT